MGNTIQKKLKKNLVKLISGTLTHLDIIGLRRQKRKRVKQRWEKEVLFMEDTIRKEPKKNKVWLNYKKKIINGEVAYPLNHIVLNLMNNSKQRFAIEMAINARSVDVPR